MTRLRAAACIGGVLLFAPAQAQMTLMEAGVWGSTPVLPCGAGALQFNDECNAIWQMLVIA